MARLTRLAAKRLLDNKDADVEVKQRKRSHPVNNKATGPVGAAIEETKSKDPLRRLPNICCDIILGYLTPIELIRCGHVSRFWREYLQLSTNLSRIRAHFPYAWETEDWDPGAPVYNRFKSLCWENRALERGEPTAVWKYRNTDYFRIAGDFVVSASENDDSIQWQHFTHTEDGRAASKAKTLDLHRDIWGHNRVSLMNVELNPDGFVFLRAKVGPSIYATSRVTEEPALFCDVVYSLTDDKCVWSKKSPTDRTYKPLLLGKDRMYFACKISSGQYELLAVEFRTDRLLYRVPGYSARSHCYDNHRLRILHGALQLIQLGDEEFLIQHGTRSLFGNRFGFARDFAIINGATGHVVQTFSYNGNFEEFYAVAKPKSSTFAMVALQPLRALEDLAILPFQTFSQETDKSFSRTAIQILSFSDKTTSIYQVLIHPFTLKAFCVSKSEGPCVMTVVPNNDPKSRSLVDKGIGELLVPLQPIRIDEYYSVAAMHHPLTLPPTNSNKRRKLKVPNCHVLGMALVDERRMLYMNVDAGDDYCLYLFDFTPRMAGKDGPSGQQA